MMKLAQQPADPFLTLGVSFVSQVCAGTHYWLPAIMPGVQAALGLSEWEATVVLAVGNAGPVLGIVGGMLHQVYGSRLTASASAVVVSLCFFGLALLTAGYNGSTAAPPGAFYLTLALVSAIVTASSPLYSCSTAAVVSLFPARFRGRLVGLNVMSYGGASGVLTAVQAVLFPTVAHATNNLYFVAACTLAVAVATYYVYPRERAYDVDHVAVTLQTDELLPLQHPHRLSAREYPRERQQPVGTGGSTSDRYLSDLLAVAYRIAVVFVVALLCNAACGILDVSLMTQAVVTLFVVSALFSMLFVPAMSTARVYPKSVVEDSVDDALSGGSGPEAATEVVGTHIATNKEPSLLDVMTDVRGMYIAAGFVVFVGGCGLFLLVQSFYLVDSLRYGAHGVWAEVEGARVVRAIVALFGACSVTGRLLMGATIDRGETADGRVVRAFRLLRYDLLVMMVMLSAVSIPSKPVVLAAVVGIGLSYGAFFCVVPTLITLWFGVATFPRNFAVFAACAVFSSATLSSSVAAWIRSRTGHWINVGTQQRPHVVCGGMMCFLPTTLPSVMLLLLMFIGGIALERVVQRRAQAASNCGIER